MKTVAVLAAITAGLLSMESKFFNSSLLDYFVMLKPSSSIYLSTFDSFSFSTYASSSGSVSLISLSVILSSGWNDLRTRGNKLPFKSTPYDTHSSPGPAFLSFTHIPLY